MNTESATINTNASLQDTNKAKVIKAIEAIKATKPLKITILDIAQELRVPKAHLYEDFGILALVLETITEIDFQGQTIQKLIKDIEKQQKKIIELEANIEKKQTRKWQRRVSSR